jgi:hypothetical protein
MDRLCIDFGVNGDGRDPQIAASANYPHRDFASISNKNFAEHAN